MQMICNLNNAEDNKVKKYLDDSYVFNHNAFVIYVLALIKRPTLNIRTDRVHETVCIY